MARDAHGHVLFTSRRPYRAHGPPRRLQRRPLTTASQRATPPRNPIYIPRNRLVNHPQPFPVILRSSYHSLCMPFVPATDACNPIYFPTPANASLSLTLLQTHLCRNDPASARGPPRHDRVPHPPSSSPRALPVPPCALHNLKRSLQARRLNLSSSFYSRTSRHPACHRRTCRLNTRHRCTCCRPACPRRPLRPACRCRISYRCPACCRCSVLPCRRAACRRRICRRLAAPPTACRRRRAPYLPPPQTRRHHFTCRRPACRRRTYRRPACRRRICRRPTLRRRNLPPPSPARRKPAAVKPYLSDRLLASWHAV